MNMLQVKKYYLLIKEQAFEQQAEKQVSTLKPLDLSNEKDELKQTDSIYPQNLMNALFKILLRKMI